MSAAALALTYLGVPRAAAARYVARGPWLLLAWAGAAALLVGSHAALRAAWPRVEARLTGSWGRDMYLLTTLVNAAAQVGCNLLLLPLYRAGATAGKAEPARAWPWASADAGERARFWAAVRRGAWLVPLNVFCVSAAGLAVLAPAVDALGLRGPTAAAAFPPLGLFAAHLAACCVVEDALFFLSHRALHSRALYARVHKVHHDYGSVVGAASEHAHPLEFLLGNLVPAIGGTLLLRPHAATTAAFLALRVAVSVEEHSGFAFDASPLRVSPWAALAAGHAWHHAHTDGVYASQFCWLDAACGTDAAFLKWLEREGGGRAAAGGKAE